MPIPCNLNSKIFCQVSMSLPRVVNSVSFLLVCFKICLSVVSQKNISKIRWKIQNRLGNTYWIVKIALLEEPWELHLSILNLTVSSHCLLLPHPSQSIRSEKQGLETSMIRFPHSALTLIPFISLKTIMNLLVFFFCYSSKRNFS